jgi:3-oxoadipate enol-lactonase
MQTVEANGELFEVQVDGLENGPVLMLSNSIGTDMRLWEPQMAAFSARYRVLRYNGRGHHPRSVADHSYTMDQLGRDALGIMNAMDVESAHWCGISLGGVVGQWLMIHAPERVKRAVLANTAAYLGPPEKWQARIDTVEREGTAALADVSLERWLTPAFRAAHPETATRAKAMLVDTPTRAYAGAAAALRDLDLRGHVMRIRHPVMVIGGNLDLATPVDDARYLHAEIHKSEMLELQAAHLSNIEATDRFNTAVLEFLGR